MSAPSDTWLVSGSSFESIVYWTFPPGEVVRAVVHRATAPPPSSPSAGRSARTSGPGRSEPGLPGHAAVIRLVRCPSLKVRASGFACAPMRRPARAAGFPEVQPLGVLVVVVRAGQDRGELRLLAGRVLRLAVQVIGVEPGVQAVAVAVGDRRGEAIVHVAGGAADFRVRLPEVVLADLERGLAAASPPRRRGS